jgi:hypothetical protein
MFLPSNEFLQTNNSNSESTCGLCVRCWSSNFVGSEMAHRASLWLDKVTSNDFQPLWLVSFVMRWWHEPSLSTVCHPGYRYIRKWRREKFVRVVVKILENLRITPIFPASMVYALNQVRLLCDRLLMFYRGLSSYQLCKLIKLKLKPLVIYTVLSLIMALTM